MNELDLFKKAIKRLNKNKPFTEKFWTDVRESIESRFGKCKEDDKKRNNIDMNKRFDV